MSKNKELDVNVNLTGGLYYVMLTVGVIIIAGKLLEFGTMATWSWSTVLWIFGGLALFPWLVIGVIFLITVIVAGIALLFTALFSR